MNNNYLILQKKNSIRRRLAKNTELEAHPPTSEESLLIHSLFMKTHHKFNYDEYVYMEDTKLQTTLFMHPQQKNIHNKIFGGFLMRMAFELSFSVCTAFSKERLSCLFCGSYLDLVIVSTPVCFFKELLVRNRVFISSFFMGLEGPVLDGLLCFIKRVVILFSRGCEQSALGKFDDSSAVVSVYVCDN